MYPGQSGGDALSLMNWQEFQHLLAEYYREQGYQVVHNAAAPSLKALSSGVDLRLRRGNESIILQCKHWDADEVPLSEVNELLGTMLNEAATGGILVTRGRYTSEARAVQRRQPRLQLIEADVLRAMLKLPDAQRDIALPANTRKARRDDTPGRAPKRRARSSSPSSMGALPIVLAAAIVLLLGLFLWRVMARRDDVAPSLAATTPAPATRPAPVAPIPDLPPAPPEAPAAPHAANGFVPRPATVDAPSASHELAERERIREEEASRAARKQNDDAMKVMERNTRAVGEAN